MSSDINGTVVAIQSVTVSSTAPTDGQVLVYINADVQYEPKSPNGDLSGTFLSTTVNKINGASVSAAGSLTTGNVLQVSGSSALTYAAINLAGGSNFVTGALPTGNQANQSLGGDLFGTTDAATVIKISGSTPIVITPTELQWINSTPSPLIDQAAKASTSSGSGSNGQILSITAQAGQAATGASHNGGNGGNLVLAGGVGGTSGSAIAGISGSIKLNGSVINKTTTITNTYSIVMTDYNIFCNFSSGKTVTLPAPIDGLRFEIWDISGTAETNNITLSRYSSEKISGIAASRVLQTNWGRWIITTDGTDWYIG